jgi:hypothetical protein
LTAAARAGTGGVQVGAEGWRRSNRGIGMCGAIGVAVSADAAQ